MIFYWFLDYQPIMIIDDLFVTRLVVALLWQLIEMYLFRDITLKNVTFTFIL